MRIASGTVPAAATTSGRSRRAAIASRAAPRFGTTDADAIAETSANDASSRRRRPSISSSSSSTVARGWVAARRDVASAPALNRPIVMFVLPMSIASSMAGSYAEPPGRPERRDP
jgi:hypothetical protein